MDTVTKDIEAAYKYFWWSYAVADANEYQTLWPDSTTELVRHSGRDADGQAYECVLVSVHVDGKHVGWLQ